MEPLRGRGQHSEVRLATVFNGHNLSAFEDLSDHVGVAD